MLVSGKRIGQAACAFLLLPAPHALSANDRQVDQEKSGTYRIDDQKYEVEWLLDEHFDSPDWSELWTVESQGSNVYVDDGRLEVRRDGIDKKEAGVTVWFNEDLPQNVVIVVDASTEPGEHACNLNFFIHARESGGQPLAYGRSGEYKPYHAIPNYLFTLTGGFMSGWTRARRDPGFVLVHEDMSVRSEPGQGYEIVMVVDDGVLSYYLDGKLLHWYEDEHPLPGGRFGLRTWFSDINYDRVRIGKILNK